MMKSSVIKRNQIEINSVRTDYKFPNRAPNSRKNPNKHNTPPIIVQVI